MLGGVFSNRWIWKTSWRDTRKQRSKLFIFCLSIVFGVATVVCITSLRILVSEEINNEAKSILGADLLIRERDRFSSRLTKIADSLAQEKKAKVARQIRFNSMALFSKQQTTSFVQVCAATSSHPYYGDVVSEPVNSYMRLSNPDDSLIALLDETLFIQKLISIGDSITIGKALFVVAGYIKKISGDNVFSTLYAPRVFIPFASVRKTELIQHGSLVSYCTYFKFTPTDSANTFIRDLKLSFANGDYRFTTPRDRTDAVSDPVENIYRFFNLIGFVAILLGVVGISSSISVYLDSKQNVIASLRCIGVTPNQIFSIYLIQSAGIGIIGSLIGIVFGTVSFYGIAYILKDFLKNTSYSFYASPIAEGFGLGVVFSILFCIPPLITAHKISPLQTIRSHYNKDSKKASRLVYVIAFTVAIALVFIYINMRVFKQETDFKQSLFFTLGLCVTLFTFLGAAKGLITFSRRYAKKIKSYSFRQGLLNLNRPNNQTVTFLISIGFGVFLLSSVFLIQKNLSYEFRSIKDGSSINLFLIDIQPDQKKSLDVLFEKLALPIVQSIPVVTMRMQRVKNKSISTLVREDSIHADFYKFEFRATHRDTLFENENIKAGTFPSSVLNAEKLITGVSISNFFAERSKTAVGDTIIFEVQGLSITTIVQSIREIDFRRLQANFSLVFPSQILQRAPSFFIYTSIASTASQSARSQQAIVTTFPNVTIFDLRYITELFENILDSGIFITQVISFICILTGFFILASGLLNSEYHRIRENALLQVLGATSKTLSFISFSEFFCIGLLSGLIGSILSVGVAYAASSLTLLIKFRLTLFEVAIACTLVTSLSGICVSVFSMILTRNTFRASPLNVLRQEV